MNTIIIIIIYHYHYHYYYYYPWQDTRHVSVCLECKFMCIRVYMSSVICVYVYVCTYVVCVYGDRNCFSWTYPLAHAFFKARLVPTKIGERWPFARKGQ